MQQSKFNPINGFDGFSFDIVQAVDGVRFKLYDDLPEPRKLLTSELVGDRSLEQLAKYAEIRCAEWLPDKTVKTE